MLTFNAIVRSIRKRGRTTSKESSVMCSIDGGIYRRVSSLDRWLKKRCAKFETGRAALLLSGEPENIKPAARSKQIILFNSSTTPMIGLTMQNFCRRKSETQRAKIRKFKSAPRERWLRPIEMHYVLRALDEHGSVFSRGLLQFVFLTAARSIEAKRLEWKDVDFANRVVTFVKTKNGKDHHLPLSRKVVLLLEDLPRLNQYVFPGTKVDSHLQSVGVLWTSVRRKAEAIAEREGTKISVICDRTRYPQVCRILDGERWRNRTYHCAGTQSHSEGGDGWHLCTSRQIANNGRS